MSGLQSRSKSRNYGTELLVRESIRTTSLDFLLTEAKAPEDEDFEAGKEVTVDGKTYRMGDKLGKWFEKADGVKPPDSAKEIYADADLLKKIREAAKGGGEESVSYASSANDLYKSFGKLVADLSAAKDEGGSALFPETSKALKAAQGKLSSDLKNKKKSSSAFTALSLFMGASAVLLAKVAREVASFDGSVEEGVDGYSGFVDKNFRPTKKWWDYTKGVVQTHVESLSEAHGFDDDLVLESGNSELLREFQFLKRLGRWLKGKFQNLFQGKDPPKTAATINAINSYFGTDFSEKFHKELGDSDSKSLISFFNKTKGVLTSVTVNTPTPPVSGGSGSGGAGEGGGESGGGGRRGGSEGSGGGGSGGGGSGGGGGGGGGSGGGGSGGGTGGEDEGDLKYLDDLTGKELKQIKKLGGPKAAKYVDDVIGAKEDLKKALDLESVTRDWVKFLFEDAGDAPTTPTDDPKGDKEDPVKAAADIAKKELPAGEDKLGKGHDITPDEAETIAKIIKKSAGEKKETKGLRGELETYKKKASELQAQLEKAGDFKESPEYKRIVKKLSEDLGVDEKEAEALLTDPEKLKRIKGDPEALKALESANKDLKEKLEAAGKRAEKAEADAEAARTALETEKGKKFKDSEEYKEIISKLQLALGSVDEKGVEELLQDKDKLAEKIKEIGSDPKKLEELENAQAELKSALEKVGALEQEVTKLKSELSTIGDTLKGENAELLKKNEQFKSIIDNLSKVFGMGPEEVQKLLSQKDEYEKALNDLRDKSAKDAKRVEELTTELAQTAEKLSSAEKRVGELENEVKTISDALKSKDAEALKNSKEYQDIIDNLSKVLKVNEEKLLKYLTEKGEYDKLISDLRKSNEEGAKRAEELTSELARVAEKLASAESELKAAKEASEKLKGEIDNLKKNKQELLDALKKSEEDKTDAQVKFENSMRELSAQLINLEIDKNKEISEIISLAKKVHNREDAKGNMTSDELIKFLELVGDPLKAEKIVAASPESAEKIKDVADAATEIGKSEKGNIADSRWRFGTSLVEAMFNERVTNRVQVDADRRPNIFTFDSDEVKSTKSEDEVIIERWQRLAGLIK